jgi:hypothetical protein
VARLALLVVLLVAGPARADERPPTSHLLWAGVAMALPTYAIGVVTHEGSHAIAATLSGARVRELHLWPGIHRGRFYFGYVEVTGLACDRQRVSFLIAPKVTDAVLLGAYAAAWYGGALPDDHYGRLALTVLATGVWVDFSRDVIAWWEHNDTLKIYALAGADTELERLPLRLLHAGLATAGAVAIVQGYRSIFERDGGDGTAHILPVLAGSF